MTIDAAKLNYHVAIGHSSAAISVTKFNLMVALAPVEAAPRRRATVRTRYGSTIAGPAGLPVPEPGAPPEEIPPPGSSPDQAQLDFEASEIIPTIASLLEGSVEGAVIATLNFDGPFAGEVTWTLVNDEGERIKLSADVLKAGATATDYTDNPELRVTVEVQAVEGGWKKIREVIIPVIELVPVVSLHPVEAGAVEDVLVGEVTIPGAIDGTYTITETTEAGTIFKAVGNKIYTGATPTVAQTSVAVGGVVTLDNGVTVNWAGTVSITQPSFPSLPFGTTAFGAWAETDYAALGLTRQGTALQHGYAEQATGAWMTPMYQRINNGIGYITLSPWHSAGPTVSDLLLGRYRGIKEVYLGADDPGALANWLKVETYSNSPDYGNNGCIVPVDTSDKATSGKSEVRAIVVPWVGEPFVLQGLPDPASDTFNGLPRINWSNDMWSLILNIDKTGSALPSGVVYIDTISGNDANDGLSDAAPVLTWEVAIAKLKTQHGTTDVGGGTIYLCAGVTHSYGVAGSPASLTLAANMPLTVTRAPGLTRSQVRITTGTTYGLYTEKVALVGVEVVGCTLEFGDPNNTTSKNYGSMRVEGCSYDGGASVDADGQTAGGAPFGFPNGFCELIDFDGENSARWGLNKLTLGLNGVCDGYSSVQDVLNNPKALSNWVVKNGFDVSGGTHVDVLQLFRSGSGTTIQNVVIEDFVANENCGSQLVLLKDAIVRGVAIARLRLQTGALAPLNTNAAYFMSNATSSTDHGSGVYFYDPEIKGGVVLWPEAALVPNVRVVMLAGRLAGKLESQHRYGKSVIYPSTTAEPEVGLPVSDIFTTTLGDDLVDYVNANDATNVRLYRETTTLDVLLNGVLGVGSYAGIAGRTQPTYAANGIVTGVPTIELNGDNSSLTSGSSLNKSSVPASICANLPCEVFGLVRNDEVATLTSTRDVSTYGSTNANSRALQRRVGNKLSWKLGANPIIDAPGTFDGVSVFHAYYNPTTRTYGVGLWNAANPTYSTAGYTTGLNAVPLFTGNSRTTIGGGTTRAGGAQGSWWNGGGNTRAIAKRNTTEAERSALIGYLIGLAEIA